MARLMRHAKRRAGRGVTLVHVLVLIVVLLFLAGLAVLTVATLRKRALVTGCMSNLGQLVQAHNTHMNSSKQTSEEWAQQAGKSWIQIFMSRAGLPDTAYYCPAAPDSSQEYGSTTESWSQVMNLPQGRARVMSSYGINGWVAKPTAAALRYSGGKEEQFIVPPASGSDRIPVFGDAIWQDGWPRAADPTPPNLRDGDRARQDPQFAPNENMLGRFTIARHGKAINVGFLDGHVETVPLKDLRRLTWHNGFVKGDWNPALPTE
jgi:prepilin-type processing-associated H-X9-DG protein